MENTLATTTGTKELSFVTTAELEKYQKVDMQVSELLQSGLTGMALTFAKVEIVQKIEEVLTEDFMKKVMNLKGKEYGFKTDEKAGSSESYSLDKVKICIVQAMLFGAEITGNEINILGGNLYLTKNFCKNWLRKNNIAYKLIPGISKKLEGGQWVIPFYIEWYDFEKNKHAENLDIPVNKFEKTSEATMRGQAERDAMAYIIEELRKESIPVNRNEDYVDTSYTEVKEKPPVVSSQPSNAAAQQTVDGNVVQPEMVSAEIQQEFDKFISNKNKVKTIPDLTNRAKNFCADKGIKNTQLNLSKFNEIKQLIDEGKWI